jgi:muramoyltetrapeptide carboxypeptidase
MDAQLIFTASRYDQQRLEEGVLKFNQHIGFILNQKSHCTPHYFYCGHRSSRLESVLEALNNEQALLLVPPRGGYGTIEILNDLPRDITLWQNKTLIGFSDLTALHSFLSNMGVSSIHGPMPATQGWIDASPKEVQSLLNAINGVPETLNIHYHGANHSGRLVGGNLTVLASLMGTPHQLKLKSGDLLFLEDINEPHYSLSRSLFQLSHSPHFNECTILWGDLSGQDLPAHVLTERLMETYTNSWGWGVPAGHISPNFSLPLGKPAQLIKDQLTLNMNP